MPEMHFVVRWPDDSVTRCYSPSLVVRDYLDAGRSYPLADFVRRTRTALEIASQRVEEKYGFACSLAAGELARIDGTAARFAHLPDASVRVESFEPDVR
jgi:uncharacterized repeat protein (TIGR04042 family)